MSRVAYVNGRYVPHGSASVHIEDRGYQFADGVYEVIAVQAGRMVDANRHLIRLQRSLDALSIEMPTTDAIVRQIIFNVVRLNRIRDGLVYLQVTRGVAKRDFPFPADTRPSLVVTARRGLWHSVAKSKSGMSAITYPDQRWARRDIKSVALLPAVLAKQAAHDAGAFEAIMVGEDGFVTEGSSSTVWIVTKDGQLITRPFSQTVLPGVTRMTIEDIATLHQLKLVERAITVEELKDAAEVFITSASLMALPITKVDDSVIGSGQPGPLTLKLRETYIDQMIAGELL